MNFKHIISAIILLLSQQSLSQNTKIGTYFWKQVVSMEGCTIDGNSRASTFTVESKINQKFRVVDVKSGFAIIKILDYTTKNNGKKDQVDESIYGYGNSYNLRPTSSFFVYNFEGDGAEYKNLGPQLANARTYNDKQIYFKVKVEILDAYAEKYSYFSGSLAIGVLNFPFKYRGMGGNSPDFGGAFNMGSAFGYKFRHKSSNPWRFTLLGGISFSNVNLDSISTSKNQSELSSINNFSALSLSAGIMLEYERAQIGVFIGSDRLNRINQSKFDWDYQGKPWLSVGIGYSIFSVENEKDSDQQKQKLN